MESRHPVEQLIQSESPAERRELRTSPRIPFDCRLFFSNGNTVEVKASLLDLSTTGCAAESETTVRTDVNFDLWIFSPHSNWRMHVDHAVVRWVRGRAFGVEFLNLRPIQRTRLRNLVEKYRMR